jgi:hypothetical protein
MPYTATPVSGSGQSGVFVVPSNSPGTAPAFVNRGAQTLFLAYGLTATLNGNNVVTGYTPSTYLFAATDGNNNVHVYGLDLTMAAAPAAAQVSSLSVALPGGVAIDQLICDSQAGFGNALQPTTLFVVLHFRGATGCNTSGDTWQVVHYTDATAAAPLTVAINSSQFTALYGPSGALSGLLLLDPLNHNLYEYADGTFTAPTVAIAGGGISAASTLYSSSIGGSQAFAGSTVFLSATVNATDLLYRVSYNSPATLVYTANGTLDPHAVHDDGNLYFSDVLVGTSTTTQGIWQVPLAGGSPTQLFNTTVPANTLPAQLVGANDSLLVAVSAARNPATQLLTDTIETLAVNGPNATAQPLGPTLNGQVSGFMLPATAGMTSSDLVFVNTDNPVAGGSYTFASEVLDPSGTSLQSVTPNSYFLEAATSPLSGAVLQLTGINSSVAGLGGGQIQAVSVSGLHATVLKAAGSGNYTLPLGDDPVLVGVSAQLAAGTAEPQAPADGNAAGLFIDLDSDIITSISLPNTAVALF